MSQPQPYKEVDIKEAEKLCKAHNVPKDFIGQIVMIILSSGWQEAMGILRNHKTPKGTNVNKVKFDVHKYFPVCVIGK